MRLITAEGNLLDEIVAMTYPVWHQGLTPTAYAQWNRAQQRTPWGRARLERVALVDPDGRLLCSAKHYRHEGRVGDRTGAWCGIGALFTPQDLRGRGYATALIEQLLAQATRDGAGMAFLFSGIAEPFYRRLGFEPVPVDDVSVEVAEGRGAPAMLVRAGDERDFPALARMHETRSGPAGFVLHRPAALIHFAVARKRLLAGLSPAGGRQVEFVVAEEGASAVAYAVLTTSGHGWTLEEAGDRDPAGARLGGILQALLAREPAGPRPLIRAWWPRPFAVPPQVTLSRRRSPREILMVRPLDGGPRPAAIEEVFYWHSDAF